MIRTYSVVIPTHDEKRFSDLLATIDSLQGQTLMPDEIVVVVDHNHNLFQRLKIRLPNMQILENRFHLGAGGSRNTGLFKASSDMVAFIDDDCVADTNWLATLDINFDNVLVIGAGGLIEPKWMTAQPRWLPKEFGWVFGITTHIEAGNTAFRTRNVWSGNMAVRRELAISVDGFNQLYSKIGDSPFPEDTEFCIRLADNQAGYWVFEPHAVVYHKIQADKCRLKFFLKRCYDEGVTKAIIFKRRLMTLNVETKYVTRVLSRGVINHIGDAFKNTDSYGLVRACLVVCGLAITTLGFLFKILSVKKM